MNVVKLEDFKRMAIERFGADNRKWKFVCPMCNTVQSAEDLVKAGAPDDDDLNGYVGFSCIGRFDDKQGCNWTLGGLFRFHKLEIETEDGVRHPRFCLAVE